MFFYNFSCFSSEIQVVPQTLQTFYLLAILMDAGNGELNPLGNVGAVVTDTLKILGDHQQIQRIFTLRGFCCNDVDDTVFDLRER